MSFVAAAMAGGTALNMGGTIFGGLFGSSAEKKRANAIRQAGEVGSRDILQSVTDANKIADEKLGVARGDLSPFRDYGVQAGNTLSSILFGGRNLDDVLKESSLFRFQSDLGSRNINRDLAARGLYGSGAGLETLARFNSQLVGEEGQRFADRLMGLTQMGQGAATNIADMTNRTGNFMANTRYQGGVESANMRYNSTVGAAQAQSNATRMLGEMGKDLFGQAGQGLMQYGNFAMNKPLIDSAISANYAMTGDTNPSDEALYSKHMSTPRALPF
jgi:hypothetical protein